MDKDYMDLDTLKDVTNILLNFKEAKNLTDWDGLERTYKYCLFSGDEK